ncbi:hypothetical protein SteCoe_11996 [Stentor coeruleus]|uniref:PARP catalytic domain-containing protein n=1 Tax=Stentor coeruleus TaxID=5963 RepID=A0A1R2CBZ3_9CILI|nr:hypothetical protein SteCoe_11996 [Stentor coeruleus]
MSEVDFLIKQFEYCLNCNYKDAAKLIAAELIKLKGKVQINHQFKFICCSHEKIHKNPFITTDSRLLQYFPQCEHYVCFNCLGKYIFDIFSRVGISYTYTCPGCNAMFSPEKTKLDVYAPYFTNVIPVERIYESIQKNEQNFAVTIKNINDALKKAECYFFTNRELYLKCNGQGRVQRMPNCNHKVCDCCFRKRLEVLKEESEFYCPIPHCTTILAHSIIKDVLIQGEELTYELWPRLKIEGISHILCFNCERALESVDSNIFILCQCGYELCVSCGYISHPGISCYVIKSGVQDYKEFECREDDEIPEMKSHYFFALSKFDWDVHEKKVDYLRNTFKVKLQLTKVNYIYNPALQQKYDKAKELLIKKGTFEGEIYVFHATSNSIYTDICKNGFKVGGIEVEIKVGNAYGFGVYTGTDPAMSICFYGKDNKKMLICKALLGKKGDHALKDKTEFQNTEDDYFFVDFRGVQTDYYIFFKKEHVLPYYYIEYQ